MEKQKIIAKVVYQDIWWDGAYYDNPPKLNVKEIEIEPDTFGKYWLRPTHKHQETGEFIRTARWSWEEMDIVEFKSLANSHAQISLYAVSSPHGRSAIPIMVLEMSKKMLETWREQDVWLKKELLYKVREDGKIFYGGDEDGTGKRCMKCGYLQSPDAVKCEQGCHD